MSVNLRGLFLCARAVFPAMKAQGKGKIINIASSTFFKGVPHYIRSEEHTSELQSQSNLVCRLLLEKKKDLRPETAPRDWPLARQGDARVQVLCDEAGQ